jgi:hypothetical protein
MNPPQIKAARATSKPFRRPPITTGPKSGDHIKAPISRGQANPNVTSRKIGNENFARVLVIFYSKVLYYWLLDKAP